jgi:hypothetical protein
MKPSNSLVALAIGLGLTWHLLPPLWPASTTLSSSPEVSSPT